MTRGGLSALCAILLCNPLSAQAEDAADRAAGPVCAACLTVCDPPLSYEDPLLDASTRGYGLDANRSDAKAAAIELAVRLNRIHLEHAEGHFEKAYAVHQQALESLAAKPAGIRATSAEIRSLKAVRSALYADTSVGLQAAATRSPTPELLTALAANQAVLDSVIHSLASPQPMRRAERLAVCEVLVAYAKAAPARDADRNGGRR